jgi:hypothetical protein
MASATASGITDATAKAPATTILRILDIFDPLLFPKSLQALQVSLAQNGLPFIIIQIFKHGNVGVCNSKIGVTARRRGSSVTNCFHSGKITAALNFTLIGIKQVCAKQRPTHTPTLRRAERSSNVAKSRRGSLHANFEKAS